MAMSWTSIRSVLTSLECHASRIRQLEAMIKTSIPAKCITTYGYKNGGLWQSRTERTSGWASA
eukprot:3410297-Pyramimonas_sp.AAC.1